MVILVDNKDNKIGTMEKLLAHKLGLLHRAFSVFVINDKQQILLQKRADCKYHSGGLWTNSCCSHQSVDETTINAVIRRTKEEIGINLDVNSIQEIGYIKYKSLFTNGLIEHEYDHILIAYSNELPILNPLEVSDFKYISLEDLKKNIELFPDNYTSWLKIILKKYPNLIF